MPLYVIAISLFVAACNVSRQPPVAAASSHSSDESSEAAEPASASARPAAKTGAAAATAGALTRVPSNMVCMVNNQYMGREQIPVVVDGRTYFGCCPMCKGRLGSDASARVGSDPVSGKPVDKALAVIAKNDVGDVFYFEDEANFNRFSARR